MTDLRVEAAVPTEMLARHADTFCLAVKRVKGLEVRKHDSTDFFERRRRDRASPESCAQLAEDPGPSLCRAPDHHAIGAALFKRTQCLGRTIDVAIDEHRHADGALDC